MSGGDWNTRSDQKQLAADAREQEREALRLEKRMLRDLRWTAERSSIGTTTGSDGWGVVVLRINWEEYDLHCDHCGSRIESAYAESDS